MVRDIFSLPLSALLSCAHKRLFFVLQSYQVLGETLPRTLPSICEKGLPRWQDFFRQLATLSGLLEVWLAAAVVCQQPVADLVEIVRQDPKPHVALKPRPPFVGTAI